MNTIRTNPHAALALACLLLALPGATAFAADKGGEIKLDAPAATKGMRVAILPVVNGSGDEDASKILEDVIRERFKEVDKNRAVFLMPDDVERILSDSDGLDRASRLTDRWSRTNAIDSTAIGGLDSLLMSDAVLLIKIGEWDLKRIHNVGQGQSSTTIGIHFALYNIRDKRKIWTKDVREQRLADEYEVSSGTVGYDATGRIQTPKVNEPPRPQDVASDLLKDALKKFPNK